MLESVAVVAGLEDVAVVREPDEQRGCQLGIAEDRRPLGEAQVRSDD